MSLEIYVELPQDIPEMSHRIRQDRDISILSPHIACEFLPMEAPHHRSLPPESLRWTCPDHLLQFDNTAHIAEDGDGNNRIIGQERALQAFQVGVEMQAIGYNIFVTGLHGNDASDICKDLLGDIIKQHPRSSSTLFDQIFLHNFKVIPPLFFFFILFHSWEW